MVLPLLPIAVGLLAGGAAYGLRKLVDKGSKPALDMPTVGIKHNAFGPDGLGAMLSFSIEPPTTQLTDRLLFVWPKRNGQYLKSSDPRYADPDGDLVLGRRIEGISSRDAQGRPTIDAFLPYFAIGAPFKGTLELVAKLRTADRVELASSSFNVELDTGKFDRQNLMSALCDAAVAAARAQGELKREQIGHLRAWVEDGLGLRQPGIETVRRYLKRAAAEPLDVSVERASFLGAVLKTELGEAAWREVVELVLGCVKAGCGSGSESVRFVRLVAIAMGAAAEEVDALVKPAVDEVEALYARLGLAPGAGREEVQRAYRERIKACHPDRFHNASEAERATAESAARELNAAYERLLEIVA